MFGPTLTREPSKRRTHTPAGRSRSRAPPRVVTSNSKLLHTLHSDRSRGWPWRHSQGETMSRYQFTSESVTEGHPDKICDQISDAILDGILAQDKKARVACETLVKTGMAVVAGEITTTAWIDLPVVIRSTIREIGYTD